MTGDQVNKISQVDVEIAVAHEVLETDSRDYAGLHAFRAARGLHQRRAMDKGDWDFARARDSLSYKYFRF